MKKQNQKKQAAPEHTTDTDGQQLVHVALANSNLRATLYAEDYRRLKMAGFSQHWQYTGDGRGSAYVTLCAYTSEGHSRAVPVARLIVDAGHGERIRCNDGNTLNLRNENLSIYAGRAWFHASDWFPTTEALRAAGIRPQKREREGTRKTHGSNTQQPHSAPIRPAEPQREPTEPPAPRKPHTPTTRDMTAATQRWRELMDAQTAGVSL